MDNTPIVESLILAQYIITKYEEDNRKLSSRNVNDLLYIFQLCYIRKFNRPLFNDEFKTGVDGPELFSSYDREFDRQSVKSLLNEFPNKLLIDNWIESSKVLDFSNYHRISVSRLSPWSVRYQGDCPNSIKNEDLIRYARADDYESVDGSYLDR